ncbi:MAG: dissimilatory-type sulfite reductase subunit alpha [Deltaproteobacteria bacterium HGW-Deltaproteobacteria-12]|jgi:sulfite reductase alpha subunit|nr:MAG: dissimilatory-type sulfite reductase subunit alpha [Deltaproteobacteria bacterium HGW-Deltaproteobacteria-12]
MEKSKTPLLDELEKGKWPSFVKDLKQAAEKSPMAKDLISQLELSYKEKIGHWKHGGIVGVKGYGSGVIGRYTDRPDLFPDVQAFHTMRVNHPTGWFYTADALRKLCDIWDKHGSGLTNMHGSTGDAILLGMKTAQLQPCFDDLSAAGFDLGGSGSALRTPSACVGPGRCEWACIDSLDICHNLTMTYQGKMHRPMFPYKFKIKVSACSNDCVASIARSDFSIIGTWKGPIRINEQEVTAYASSIDIQKEVCDLCPTKCMEWDGKKLKIQDGDCNRCMHCINLMSKALRPGKEQGATILVGGKAPIVEGALMSWVIVPFMKLEPPYTQLKDLIDRIQDWWDEHGKSRERLGELITRVGMRVFLRAVGLPAIPQMVKTPRSNPYVFFWPENIQKQDEIAKEVK